MDLSIVIRVLWLCSIGLLAVLAIRLLVSGLWTAYRSFTFYILALCAESIVLLLFSSDRLRYGNVWAFTRAVVLIFEVRAVISIFDKWTSSYPGIGSFGRRLFYVLMIASVGLFFSSLPVGWSMGALYLPFQIMAIVNRGANAACFAFLIFTLAFFCKFGGPVASNLRRHTFFMTAFVTANALSYLAATIHAFSLGNIMISAISIAALVLWIFGLTVSGEIQPVTADNPEEWAAAERMNRQLLKLSDSIRLSPAGLKQERTEETQIQDRLCEPIPAPHPDEESD